jgi:hypothetical protein
MKDQYFGDVNDYRKYAILAGLANMGELCTGICWMLTAADGRSDGSALRYLTQPAQFRSFSPQLFDFLYDVVTIQGDRRVMKLEESDVLPNTVFYSEYIADKSDPRQAYFRGAFDAFIGADIVFFDPDNGIEVPSVALGRKMSSKFLYWRELVECYQSERSVIVYQHFPRKCREQYLEERATALLKRTGAQTVLAFVTPRVVFFVVPQVRHESIMRSTGEDLTKAWQGQIVMRTYRLSTY